MSCQSKQDCTGGYSCARCGYCWDADDTDIPQCKTDERIIYERAERSREIGRNALNKLHEDLES